MIENTSIFSKLKYFQVIGYVNKMASVEEKLNVLMNAYKNYEKAKNSNDQNNEEKDTQSNGMDVAQLLTEAYRKYSCVVVSTVLFVFVLLQIPCFCSVAKCGLPLQMLIFVFA